MYRIGIDLGGTFIAAGLVNESLRILDKLSVPTSAPRPMEGIADDMAALTGKLLERSGLRREELAAVGVGVPGTANRENGHLEDANNLGFDDEPFVSVLEERLGLPVRFGNDANAAAWGEYLVLDKKPDSFLMVTLGTGVGGGIIQDGKILRGVNYAAGELGHMTIRYNGIPCNCGRRGCLEAYASAEALIARARRAMDKKRKSFLWELCGQNQENMNAKLVFDAYRQGDKTAVKVLEKYAELLSEGLANMINILQPRVLCIGGGISRSGDILLPMLRERVSGKIYSRDSAVNTELRAARLDNDAGIIGAAKLWQV